MRILLNDFAGHAFPIQLSRELARRGHTVRHVYCDSLTTTPQGSLAAEEEDAPTLSILPIRLTKPLQKYNFFLRRKQEIAYGRYVSRAAAAFRPDVVLSANTPLDSQRLLLRLCRRNRIPFVFWVQDLLGVGTYRLLRKKVPILGAAIGRYYMRMEQVQLRNSDGVVLISKDFQAYCARFVADQQKIHVVPNWAPIEELPVQPKENAWSRAQGLSDGFCFLYSGTMGMKHNPQFIEALALHFRDDRRVRIVVVSNGLGADWLAEQKRLHGLDNLLLLGFQPYAQMPEVLGTADVLVAVLEPDAGAYSVPSKVLSYLCAGRSVLLSVPQENLAARMVIEAGAGFVSEPGDRATFIEGADRLLQDTAAREAAGRNARRYAEAHFDIASIADRFERICAGP